MGRRLRAAATGVPVASTAIPGSLSSTPRRRATSIGARSGSSGDSERRPHGAPPLLARAMVAVLETRSPARPGANRPRAPLGGSLETIGRREMIGRCETIARPPGLTGKAGRRAEAGGRSPAGTGGQSLVGNGPPSLMVPGRQDRADHGSRSPAETGSRRTGDRTPAAGRRRTALGTGTAPVRASPGFRVRTRQEGSLTGRSQSDPDRRTARRSATMPRRDRIRGHAGP